MKKFITFVSVLFIFASLLTYVAMAATEEIDWGSQSFKTKTTATVGGYTSVSHSFTDVGFTYLYADCPSTSPNAYFTTEIAKKTWYGAFSTKDVVTCPASTFRYNIEWGYGDSYGSGSYRFILTAKNNRNVYTGSRDTITIQNFYSKSDP